ncbi:MAG: ATP-dependent helicase/nuclease subunit A, partial [Pelotomaculum thermopropionicum]
FPVVFVAGLGKKFNFKDLSQPVLFHKDLGAGPELVDYASRVTYPTAAKLALKHRLKMEVLAEEMRILYVAMTRAREKLILVGSARNLPACAGRWCGAAETSGQALPDGILAGATSFLDWLGPALVRHRDGAEIRKLGLVEPALPGTATDRRSAWKIFINRVPAGSSGAVEQSAAERFSLVRRMEPAGPAGEFYAIVKSRLEWSYPFAAATVRAAKVSVTEIKRKFEVLSQEEAAILSFQTAMVSRPDFLQRERGLTAAEKGTVLHLVMQNLNLKQKLDVPGIREQIAGMVESDLLTPEQALSLSVEAIAAFFDGNLGRRVLAAREVLRELPFTMAVPAEEIYPDSGESGAETVIVQGVLDCLVDEGDGYLLLDYKTGKIKPELIDMEAAKYRTQLNLYAGAVESILGKVKEKWLHFFEPGLSKKF